MPLGLTLPIRLDYENKPASFLLKIVSFITLLGLTLRLSELEIMSNIISQLVFYNKVLPPDVLTRVTIGKYATGFIRNSD